ncbi:MAG: nucleotide exchange factor GrpE [Aridibacter sp.]
MDEKIIENLRNALNNIMSWFNKMMNNEEFNTEAEEIIDGEVEEISFEDNRRINEDGERINVEVKDDSEFDEVQTEEEIKSPEVVKLENALIEMTQRADAAENKLLEVQKRFEEERSKLENETVEMRERMKKSLEQQAEQGRLKFLNALLPVLDNLNLGIMHAEENHSFENLIEGVKGTARSFERALVSVGVETIDSVGEKFDPEFHEAVEMKEVDEEEKDGIVTQEFTEGYTFKGRLLRAARVQVGKFVQTQANTN